MGIQELVWDYIQWFLHRVLLQRHSRAAASAVTRHFSEQSHLKYDVVLHPTKKSGTSFVVHGVTQIVILLNVYITDITTA